jgi:membrane-bound inhibitor of C-type lysozyme
MNNKTLIALIVVVLLVVVGVLVIKKSPNQIPANPTEGKDISITATGSFLCSNGSTIDAIFTENSAIVSVDEQVLELPQVVSASGARYANADESFVFWNKGNTVFIEQSGEITYNDCLQKDMTPESTMTSATEENDGVSIKANTDATIPGISVE